MKCMIKTQIFWFKLSATYEIERKKINTMLGICGIFKLQELLMCVDMDK